MATTLENDVVAERRGADGGRGENAGASCGGLRRRLAGIARVVLTFGLLALLLRKISLADVISAFERCVGGWYFLLFGFALPILGLTASGTRWQVLLRGQGVRVPLRSIVSALLVGNFFNQLLPSTIGGDFVRSRRIAVDGSAPYLVSLAIVALDRAMGILGILVVALVAAAFSPTLLRDLPHVPWIVAAITVGFIASALLIASSPGRAMAERILSLAVFQRVRGKVRAAYEAAVNYRHQKWRLLVAFLLSLGLQVLIILEFSCFAAALQLDVSPWGLATVVPLVTVISLIPITIGGIGLRENAFAVFGASLGMTAVDAVAISWLFVGCAFSYGLLGGVIHLLGRRSLTAEGSNAAAERGAAAAGSGTGGDSARAGH